MWASLMAVSVCLQDAPDRYPAGNEAETEYSSMFGTITNYTTKNRVTTASSNFSGYPHAMDSHV